MDPLSVAASITGILAAAAKVVSILSQIREAPAAISSMIMEIEHIEIVFRALQRFIDRTTSLTRQRASMIQLEDVTVLLTQTVLVFSELETLVLPLSVETRQSSIRRRVVWSRKETAIIRLCQSAPAT
jgi:hypothetical protein